MSTEDTTTPTKLCTKCGRELPATTAFFGVERSKLASWCRACKAEYTRRWNEAHPGVNRERQRKWREEHPGQNVAQVRKWREANPERFREDSRERSRLWRQAHPEYRKEWGRRNPDSRRATMAKRRASRNNNGGSHTAEDIQAQYDRQKGRCFYCGKKVGKKYHVDHVIPLAAGGSNGPENIVISCPDCNMAKGAKHPMDFDGRLL